MDKWVIENQVTITLVISAAAALATIIYAILTFILVHETIKLRKADTDPDIVVYLEPFHASFVNMVIKNIGRGAASDITFIYDHSSPLADLSLPQGSSLNHINLFNGLPYLAPGHEIKFFFLTLRQYPNPELIPPLDITVNYRNKGNQVITSTYKLSVSDFLGLRWIGSNPLEDASKALETIKTDFHAVIAGSRININSFPQPTEDDNESQPFVNIDNDNVDGNVLS